MMGDVRGEACACVLTIAGTDPCGGAGVQVDLQVFRDHDAHGLSVITAVLWQNTVGVRGWRALEPAEVVAQLDAVLEDLPVQAIKIGVVPTAETAHALAERLEEEEVRDVPVVLDPVLASGDGRAALVRPGTTAALRDVLFPRCALVTPNVPEAAALLGRSLQDRAACLDAAARLADGCGAAVLLKGGHLDEGDGVRADMLALPGEAPRVLEALPAIDEDVRGTGCQLSSAIAARLGRGVGLEEAIDGARRYVSALLHTRRRHIGTGRAVVVRVGR